MEDQVVDHTPRNELRGPPLHTPHARIPADQSDLHWQGPLEGRITPGRAPRDRRRKTLGTGEPGSTGDRASCLCAQTPATGRDPTRVALLRVVRDADGSDVHPEAAGSRAL